MAMNLKPLGDRVLVEPAEERETKKGGIIIPDSAKEKPTEGVIIALGTGKTDDDGKKVPFEVKKGDRVLVSKYGGTENKMDGKENKNLNSDDILAAIEKPQQKRKKKKIIYGRQTNNILLKSPPE